MTDPAGARAEAEQLATALLHMIPTGWKGKAEPPYSPEVSIFAYVADPREAQAPGFSRGVSERAPVHGEK